MRAPFFAFAVVPFTAVDVAVMEVLSFEKLCIFFLIFFPGPTSFLCGPGPGFWRSLDACRCLFDFAIFFFLDVLMLYYLYFKFSRFRL